MDRSSSPMFRKTKRIPPARQVLVTDKVVQGALLRRLAFYGACGLFYFSVIEFLDVALANPAQSRWEIAMGFFERSIYWAPGIVVLMPIFAYDLLRFSNRLTGPVTRLRKEMRDLKAGVQSEPIEFRRGDFLREMADEYNSLRDEIVELREQVASASAREPAARMRKGSLFGKKGKDVKPSAESAETLLEPAGT